MFKKIAFFALFLAVTGLFAAESVNAQRLIKGSLVKSTETTFEIVPEANPAVNLDQCHNGANAVPLVTQDCGPGWVNGNANGNNSHYAEGTNIHYRASFINLVPGTLYTVTFGFDKTHSSGGGDYTKNAIDYINNYDATAVGYSVTPCFDGSVTLCTGAPVLIPIPDDPGIPFDPAGRTLAGWGIATLAVEPLTAVAPVGGWVSPTSSTVHEQLFSVTFRSTGTSAVLAWSGHIAMASDWNQAPFLETSASSINGSPYHMRVAGNTGWGGQQDRSLSTTAVVGPSAADAEITGRVTDAYGRAISSAKMTLNNASTGEVEVVYTNSFGYYTFKDVPVGDFFVMTVQHSRYRFVSGSVSFALEDSIAGLDFKASR